MKVVASEYNLHPQTTRANKQSNESQLQQAAKKSSLNQIPTSNQNNEGTRKKSIRLSQGEANFVTLNEDINKVSHIKKISLD